MHYNISRSSKIKSLANQSIVDKLSPIAPKNSTKVTRTHSLAESKKHPKLLIKNSKYPKTRIEVDLFTRMSKTPTPPSSHPPITSDTKGQVILYQKNEISALKDNLTSAKNTIDTLNQVQEVNTLLKNEKKQLESCLSNLIQECLKSEEVSLKFKRTLPEFLKGFLDEDSKILRDIEKIHPRVSIGDKNCRESGVSAKSTARFKSNEDFKVVSKGEGIAIEDFYTETEGFLKVKAGDRVLLLGKPDEFNWVASFQGVVAKVPVSIIFID